LYLGSGEQEIVTESLKCLTHALHFGVQPCYSVIYTRDVYALTLNLGRKFAAKIRFKLLEGLFSSSYISRMSSKSATVLRYLSLEAFNRIEGYLAR
jgi:hypothetical protein